MKNDILDRIKQLQKEFADKLAELEKKALADDSTAFEVGKWYYGEADSCDLPYLLRYRGMNPEKRTTTGDYISINNDYSSWGSDNVGKPKNLLRPATPTEIQLALVAEATKRGFKEGASWKHWKAQITRKWKHGHFFYNYGCDHLEIDGFEIYKEGQWAEIIQEEKPVVEPEPGKWYHIKTNVLRCYIKVERVSNNDIFGYGLDVYTGHWCNPGTNFCRIGNLTDIKKANEKEVSAMFKNMAQQKGFTKGAKVKRSRDFLNSVGASNDAEQVFTIRLDDDYIYENNRDALLIAGRYIYHKGRWGGEIVATEPPIEIGGYPVIFGEGHGDETMIDGYVFTREFWLAAKKVASHSKAKIKIGCSHQFDLPLETIDKILEKL